MVQAWIVRSLRAEGYEDLAFGHDLIAVGWGKAGDLASLDGYSEVREVVRAAYPFVERESADGYARQLFEFRSVVRQGDLVLLLRRRTPAVAAGWVSGSYRYRTDLGPDIGHVRAVRWVRRDLPRAMVEREVVGSPPLSMLSRIDGADVAERLRLLVESPSESVIQGDTAPSGPIPERSRPFITLQSNLAYARSLATAGQHLDELKVGSFEVRDVFRAAWVQGVAALDHWVRQEVRSRMLRLAQQHGGNKPKGFQSFEVPLGRIDEILQSRTALVKVLDEQLSRTRGHYSYQNPAKIQEAFRMVSDVSDLWEKVARVLNERSGVRASITAASVRDQLRRIADRRNKIAHENDEDPGQPPNKRSIDAGSVMETLDYLEQVAAAILVVVDQESS